MCYNFVQCLFFRFTYNYLIFWDSVLLYLSLKLDLNYDILLVYSFKCYHIWFWLKFWIFNIFMSELYVPLEENLYKKSQVGNVIEIVKSFL